MFHIEVGEDMKLEVDVILITNKIENHEHRIDVRRMQI